MQDKRCIKCGQTKPINDFYAHKMMKDGHLNECKECTKKRVRDHYRMNPEARAVYERRRAKDPKRRAAQARYNRASALRNPGKRAARVLLGNALRDGRIKKGPCENCGRKDGVEAHHEDYCRPLDVSWFCFGCHQKRHGNHAVAERRFKRGDQEDG